MQNSTTLSLAKDARHSRIGAEGILLRQKLAEVLVVNELAIRILELLDKPQTLEQLAAQLTAEYEVAEDVLRADLARFTQSLLDEGILTQA